MTIKGFKRLENKIDNAITMKTPIESMQEITLRSDKQVDSLDVTSFTYKQEKKVTQQESTPKVVKPIMKSYVPPVLYPGRIKKNRGDEKYNKLLDMIKKLHTSIPLVDTLKQMPQRKQFLKEFFNKKKRLNGQETVMQTQEYTNAIKNTLPPKLKDLDKFTLRCIIGNLVFENALYDLSARVNLIPLLS